MNVVPRNAPQQVGDLMTAQPVVVHVDAMLADAARLLDQHRIDGLPVVDATGALVGVISQTDLLRARATEYLWANWAALRVKHLMTSPALTIGRSQSLSTAARKMERNHVHRLVVVADDDESQPVGVISTSDLVHEMSSLDAEPDERADAGPVSAAGGSER